MVFEGYLNRTLDINISFEVCDDHLREFVVLVRDLGEQLSLNIEEASPSDFIPVPAGHRERSPYIGRYGKLEVFHFDLYSMALSKIERGTESDFDDVLILLHTGRIDMPDLSQYFEEIMKRYGPESIRQDPIEYRTKFEILREMWKNCYPVRRPNLNPRSQHCQSPVADRA